MSEIQPVSPPYPIMKSKKVDKDDPVAGQVQHKHKKKPESAEKDDRPALHVDENV